MNRRQLATALANKTKIQVNICDEMLKSLMVIITEELSKGGYVKLAGFGTFDTVWKKERKGRNPQKPEKIYIIPASNIPRFRPGKNLKKAIK